SDVTAWVGLGVSKSVRLIIEPVTTTSWRFWPEEVDVGTWACRATTPLAAVIAPTASAPLIACAISYGVMWFSRDGYGRFVICPVPGTRRAVSMRPDALELG